MKTIPTDLQPSNRLLRLIAGAAVFLFCLQLVARCWILTKPSPAYLEQLKHFPDIELYFKYAQTIINSDTYAVGGNYALRTPGLPFLLAISNANPYLFIGIIATANIFWIHALGKCLERHGAPRGSALTATLFALIEPYSFVVGCIPLSETPFTFLLLAFLYLTAKWIDRPRNVLALLIGIVAALATYVRPSGIAFFAVSAALGAASFLFSRAGHSLRHPFHLLWALLAFLLAMAPWWYRSVILFGALVLTTTNVGESLYDGWNPKADGSSNFWFKQTNARPELGELDQDRHWRHEAIAWATNHPASVARLAWIKFLRFWSPWPNESSFQIAPTILITTLLTLPIYLLAGIGWTTSLLHRPGLRTLAIGSLLPIVIFCAMHMVFVSSVRYRVPMMPILVLWAGVGLAGWMCQQREFPNKEAT